MEINLTLIYYTQTQRTHCEYFCEFAYTFSSSVQCIEYEKVSDNSSPRLLHSALQLGYFFLKQILQNNMMTQ